MNTFKKIVHQFIVQATFFIETGNNSQHAGCHKILNLDFSGLDRWKDDCFYIVNWGGIAGTHSKGCRLLPLAKSYRYNRQVSVDLFVKLEGIMDDGMFVTSLHSTHCMVQ